MKVKLYTQKGEEKGTLELPKEMFECEFNKDLVHQALVRQLSNNRLSTAHSKTKGEVRGGGAKPFKQKGTGRARQGSIRSPHMKGGGVTFGPRNVRNFTKMMPVKQRRKALFCALSEKARNNQVIGLEEFKTDKPKTKEFAELLKKLPVEKDALVLIPQKDQIIQKSIKNLARTKAILAAYVNIQDLQKYETIIIIKDAVETLKKTFLEKTTATKKEEVTATK